MALRFPVRDRAIVVRLCLLFSATTSDVLRAFLLPARAVDHHFAGGSVLDGSNDMVDTLLDIFDQHAYMILFVWVLVESLGAPVAGEVVLLLAGSLVVARQLNPVGVIMSAWVGGMLGDALVFRLGQHIGDRSLRRLLAWIIHDSWNKKGHRGSELCYRSGSHAASAYS